MDKALQIATHMVDIGTKETTTGNYHFYFDEISKIFDVDLPNDKALLSEIISHLQKGILGAAIVDLDTSEGFDFIFWLSCCPNVEEEETC